MKTPSQIAILLVSALSALSFMIVGCASESPTLAPTVTATPTEASGLTEKAEGHEIFISKGCAACHGQNAEGSTIAPSLAGHTEAMVERQVRNPRFRMPSFTEDQVSDGELGAIAHYIASLSGEGHAHPETIQLAAAVEMHHWMALEALKVDDPPEGIHHVKHIIDLLEPGEHRQRMEVILGSLEAGERHDPEHEIEEMLAGTAAPALTLFELHLRQALVALAVEDLSDAQHHVVHAQALADAAQTERISEILNLLQQVELHSAEHEIQELLGKEDRHRE